MLREMEDEDTLFDKQTLLNSDPTEPDIEFSGGQKSDWCSKFTKTIVLSIAFFALGLCIAIPGPTLLDLGERVHTDTEHMSMIFMARSVGYLLGSIVGGFLFDHFDQQILMFYTLIMSAIATVVAPWCTVLVVLAVMISFQGVSMGILDTGGNVFCIQIWKHKSAPYMQGLHFAFGIGAFIAPLLARPFLNHIEQPGFLNHSPQLGHSNNSLLTIPLGLTSHAPNIPNFALFNSNDHYAHLINRRDANDVTGKTDRSMPTTPATVNYTVSALKVTDSNYTSSTTLASTTKPTRPTKPGIIEGKHLSIAYSDGKNAQDAIKDASKKKVLGDKNTEDNSDDEKLHNVTAIPVGTVNVSFARNKTSDENAMSALIMVPTSTPTVSSSAETTLTAQMPSSTTQMPSSTTQKPSSTTQKPSSTTQKPPPTTQKPPPTTQKPPSTTQKPPPTTQKLPLTSGNNILSSTTSVDHKSPPSTVDESTVNQTLTITTTEQPKKPETFGDFVNKTLNAVAHMSRIQFAYAIIGVLLIINAFMFLVLYCKDRRQSPSQRRAGKENHRYSEESTSFRMVMLLLLFLFFFAYVGMEVTFGGLLSTFVVEYLHWSKAQGATATALFWGSLAAGRGISIFIAKCFKPPCMLISNTFLVVIGAFILSFGIQINDIFLWVGTVTIGFGMSSIFPTGISWADHYFPLTGKATAVFVVGSALGEMAIPVLTGYLYENKDKMFLMYMMVAVGLFCVVLYVIMQCIASHKKTKSASETKNGFLRLDDDDDNIPMDSLAASYGTSDYVEQARKRPATSVKSVVNEPEYDLLIDIDD
ncbi:sodium-dependent glucose transporter 1-like [Gigantopelta aegis]|uniref:sodium-dependent glucose transporter 1-like n=1 Tax=Gigantopelta aegis TaxID=1735272 RepID=UPI001B88CB92|nr:sodium-dependent glucose transporter 1-like [Gigantopelta aegis]XP_041365273.1 sodium-dependent glucose transporter 1-like [Gigantopelta aegis]